MADGYSSTLVAQRLSGLADEGGEPVEVVGMAGTVGGELGGVDIDFEEFGGAFGEEFDGVGGGRDEDAFAGMDGDDVLEGLDGGDAFDTEIDNEGVEAGEVLAHGLVEGDEVGDEVGALDKGRGGVGTVVVVGAAVAEGGEVEGVEGLFGVEGAETAVGVGTVVVVEAVGAVAGLLYLGQQEAFAYGVDTACGDEKDVAGLGLLNVEEVDEGVLTQVVEVFVR